MLVVFLQVLLVSVLGLTNISRDRQEARRTSEERATAEARTLLKELIWGGEGTKGAVDEVADALVDVQHHVQSYEDLTRLRQRSHAGHIDLIGTIYHVDPETGEIFWLDGEHFLFVPAMARQALERLGTDAEWGRRYTQLRKDAADDSALVPEGRLLALTRVVEDFPYKQGAGGYPETVGEAYRLVRMARDLAFRNQGPESYEALERALLAALQVVALNKDRLEDLPPADVPQLDRILEEVWATLLGLPPAQRGIRNHVEAYWNAREALSTGRMREVIGVALEDLGSTPSVVRVRRHLVGLVPNVRANIDGTMRHAVVLLNEDAAQHMLQAKGAGLGRRGLALHLVPRDQPKDPRMVASEDLLLVEGLKLPDRAELERIEPLELPVEGPGEFFWWGVILLATGGLAVGAWVLTRLYTREVRLARLKADFVSNLSHELKTPLTSIAMFTEMLQHGQLTSEEDQQEGLAILAQESERLQGIVARMLDIARREARGTHYELAPGDLNEIVARAAERFRRIVTEPGLHLDVSLSPQPLTVMMDAAAMDDVVTNLISNAWKYKQGESARIQVRTARRGRRAEIVVNDDGVGIPRAERRKVFEMFYRADAYLTQVSGTGLGLALVRTILKAHKGSIRVENGEDGRGTLFRIRLPRRKGAASSSPPSPHPVGSSASPTEA